MKAPVISSKGRLSARECAESWSIIYERTVEVRKVWPSIWTVPEVDEPMAVIGPVLPAAGALLEVGGSNTSHVRAAVARSHPQVQCFSFDIDRRTQQDFHSWTEVKRSFDCAVCFEVIEHIPVADGLELCSQVFDHLEPGGGFVIGTPNIFHPTRYLQDPTHVTPWCYDRLAGALLALGFDICAIAKQRAPQPQGTWKARLAASLAAKLRPHLGLDSAHSVYVAARRPDKPAAGS